MKQRIVVVTRGGTGIGRAIAGRFLRDGSAVVLTGRRGAVMEDSRDQILEATSMPAGHVTSMPADLAAPLAVDLLAERIASRHGSVEVLVNNAGAHTEADWISLADTARQWEADLRSNMLTAALTTQALTPMLRSLGDRIINISSITAFRGGLAPFHAATKAALIGWTYHMVEELSSGGITVNGVAPGYIEDTEFFGGAMTPARLDRLRGETLTGTVGTPADVAEAVAYLALEAASFTTGEVLHVNGGALLQRRRRS
ncbi:SDR family NAD(P)-dependent oxidoreductase [Streptomyces sp. NPDC056519]|uniref:SDR family NAD(P)-dependent oxidoreductase n=1 Tax=Streptomyces sp. NPDC056519 TaxID=3345849 RepID=UPI003674F954